LAASTVRNYLEVARLFMSHRKASAQPDLREVTVAQVCEFVVAGCRDRSVGSATLLVVGLRALLRYLHVAGVTASGLADAVPTAASWPSSSLPQPIDRRQAVRLLRSCDRRTAVGRRDFAVLTVQLRLGLRVGEVAALDLGDVDWHHGEMLVHGKGHRNERLPLPTDIGEALVGWLRRGRRPCGSTRLFTTLIAPRGEMTSKAVSAIVRRASVRSGVAVTGHGLRHTAGTKDRATSVAQTGTASTSRPGAVPRSLQSGTRRYSRRQAIIDQQHSAARRLGQWPAAPVTGNPAPELCALVATASTRSCSVRPSRDRTTSSNSGSPPFATAPTPNSACPGNPILRTTKASS